MAMSTLDLSHLPTPLARAISALNQEDDAQPFRGVHRLIDTVEVFCKLYTVAGVSQLADLIAQLGCSEPGEDDHQERLDKMKTMLVAGLRTPSLGVWWQFARESAKIIEGMEHAHILPQAIRALTYKRSKLRKAFDDDNNSLIKFRNGYAHGATPKDEACRQDLAKEGKRLAELINNAQELREVELIVTDAENQAYLARGLTLSPLNDSLKDTLSTQPQRCYLRSDARADLVDLHPLLCYREAQGDDLGGFYYYNDLRNKYASILNYPEAAYLRDKEVRSALLDRFPLEQWKKELRRSSHSKRVDLNPFRERIEELIEVFKGRRDELTAMVEHLSEHSAGFYMIWGPPGVGKSALLARFSELLRWEPPRRAEAYPEIEWPQLDCKLVDYYIRRGDTDKASDMFDTINQRLDALYNMNLALGSSLIDKQKLFYERLRSIAERLDERQRLILIFDGLDEAPDELIKLLPRTTPQQVPEQIMVFYGARPQRDLKYNFYDTLEREKRAQITLTGLGVQDTRALLYEHVNKYELQHTFVEAVREVSEGNPLYLKLLCQGLEQGTYKLNDIEGLPTEITTLYENALVRMQQEHPDSGALLCLLAAAKDAMSVDLAAELLQGAGPQSGSRVESGPLAACYELLTSRTQLRRTSYQLFHESLREHLNARFTEEVRGYAQRLKAWCTDWVDEDGDVKHDSDEAQRYAMRYAVPHILDHLKRLDEREQVAKAQRERDALLSLVDDERWRRANFRATGSGEAMRLGFTSAQQILTARDPESPPLNEIMRYALWYHEEPRRYYEEQRALLSTAPKRGEEEKALERVIRMASMGDTPRVKLLLAISALWAPATRPAKSALPEALIETVEEWLEEARDPNLEDLWGLSHV